MWQVILMVDQLVLLDTGEVPEIAFAVYHDERGTCVEGSIGPKKVGNGDKS
jgi:hypothetical protein